MGIISTMRLISGGAVVWGLVSGIKASDLKGEKYPNPKPQIFVDELVKTRGIFKKIPVREVSQFTGKPVAFSNGNLIMGNAQILIPKNTPLTDSELSFVCAHELGHITEHHSLILGAVATANAALLAIPIVPIRVFSLVFASSAISIAPLYYYMEKRADSFALKYCPDAILKQSEIDGFNRSNVSTKK